MKLTKALMALLASTSAPLVLASPMILDTQVINKEHAPLLSSTNSAEIEDSYIVVFKKHVSESSAFKHHQWVKSHHVEAMAMHGEESLGNRGYASAGGLMNGGIQESDFVSGLKHIFSISEFKGYSGSFHKDTIDKIRSHPDVDYIEKDSMVHAIKHNDCETEKGAPWGLARVSHKESLNFGNFNKYLYAADGGENVDVYVIDTGTNYNHVDFEGRAKWGKTIPNGDVDEDGNGHGTHCSGTIAGKKYGVAKKANVYAVKVLKSNGSGTMSDVVKGVEWAVKSHLKQSEDNKKLKGSVANMSLGGGKSPTLDMAVNAAVDNGVHFAVAAGNDNADACNYSPAASNKAVTVGASTLGDERAYFSNYGKCVDIFAPGLNIQSTWIGSEHAINTISGTSMASPHIAGLLAYFVSLQPSKGSEYAVDYLTPKKMKKNMIAIASEGVLSGIPSDTVNLLAYNGGGSNNFTEIFDGARIEDVTEKETTTGHKMSELFEEGESLLKKAKNFAERIEEYAKEQL